MQKIIGIGLVLILISCAIPVKDQNTVQISTFAIKIPIQKEVTGSNGNLIFRITNEDEKQIVLSGSYNYLDSEYSESLALYSAYESFLNTIEFSQQICYIVSSDLTRDLELEQPYHDVGSNKLIFDLVKGDLQPFQYLSLRLYPVARNADHFEFYMRVNGVLEKLNVTEFNELETKRRSRTN